MRSVEILSPCGSYESVRAAIGGGADAIYLGGSAYGARAYAGNFDKDELIETIKYAHLYGVSVYLTVNTLFKNEELNLLYDFLCPYYEAGLDAVIVQDIGVIKYIHACFPNLSIHASTQLSTTGVYGSRHLKDMGVSRIVTAREISLDEIKKIHDNVDIEIESFVHGAMCYSYSGQCLISSFIGDRSGNRGRCAGSCRLPYEINNKELYLLSLKDMATLSILPDIIDAGVYSLKIEGRMKNPEYCAFVTSMYKKYANMYLMYGRDNYKVSEDDYRDLLDIFNRGNFSTGFYKTHNSKDMMSFNRPNHQGVLIGQVVKKVDTKVSVKLVEDLNNQDILDVKEKYEYTYGKDAKINEIVTLNVSKKSPLKVGDKIYRTRNNKLLSSIENIVNNKPVHIKGIFEAYVGKKPSLTFYRGDDYAYYQGEEDISLAIKKSLSEDDIRKNISKTGNTNFVIDELDINISDDIFIPVGTLNNMRRECLKLLYETIASKYYKHESIYNAPVSNINKSGHSYNTNVCVESEEAVGIVVKHDFVKRIYIESYAIKDISRLIKLCHDNNKELYVALPYICRKNSYESMAYECDGFLVRNLEELGYIRENTIDRPLIFDYNMYSYNNEAASYYNAYGQSTCGLEVSYKEQKEFDNSNMELIIYGYIPMMISASCINKNINGCDKLSKKLKFKDRFGNEFLVKNICRDCYNIIYNYRPLALYDREEDIRDLGIKSVRIVINSWDEDRIDEILGEVNSHVLNLREYTRGHFYKNIL